MANFNKAFNFRGGFQVDTDILVVRGQTVGIGSSVPTERLDVDGTIKAKGLIVDSTQDFFISTANVGVLSAFEARAGIFTGTPENNGIATYYGDGSQLSNLPTSQWVDVDVGLGFTSIYAAGYVGVDTTDPRYVFQVGGAPFGAPIGSPIPPEQGVAIENGNLYVSDNIRVGGGISIGSTIVPSDVTVSGTITAGQFVGMGSGITVLNADNLGVGSIGSMRYGDVIVTKEVLADSFIGTASVAITLEPTSEIDIVTAKADRVEADDKFISTTGYLQIGIDDDVSNRGDIEVFKEGAQSSTIYSISTAGTGRMYVGAEREGGTNIRLGGLRKGISSLDPNSNIEDLDLVNLDTGNLNFYLHSGNSGSTSGNFRWLYGQTDEILADMTRGGKFTLYGGAFNFGDVLDVRGSANFDGSVVVGGGMTVSGDVSFETVSINQPLNVSSIGVVTAAVSSQLGVGINPEIGGTGSLITSEYSNISGIATFSRTNGVDVLGNLSALTVTGDLVGDVTADSVTFLSNLSNTNFTVDFDGNISANDIACSNVNTGFLTATSVDASEATFSNLTVTGSTNLPTSISLTDLSVGNIQSGSATITDLTVTNSVILPAFDYTGSVAQVGDLAVTGIATINTLELNNTLTVNSIEVNQLASSGPSIQITSQVNANDVIVGKLTPNDGIDAGGVYAIRFDYDDNDEILTFNIIDGSNNLIGVSTLPVNTQ